MNDSNFRGQKHVLKHPEIQIENVGQEMWINIIATWSKKMIKHLKNIIYY